MSPILSPTSLIQTTNNTAIMESRCTPGGGVNRIPPLKKGALGEFHSISLKFQLDFRMVAAYIKGYYNGLKRETIGMKKDQYGSDRKACPV